MKKLILIFTIFSSMHIYAKNINTFQYKNAGILFSYDNVSIDKNSGKEEPLSVVFIAGARPFAVSILFREEKGFNSLDEFIKAEKEAQKKGGYEKEATILKDNVNNISAYEIIRDSKHIKIRWFVFSSLKNDKIYSFLLGENSGLKKENSQAIKAYQSMKSSLTLVK